MQLKPNPGIHQNTKTLNCHYNVRLIQKPHLNAASVFIISVTDAVFPTTQNQNILFFNF